MAKFTTEYKPNEQGEIVKIEYIDGEVMPDGFEPKSFLQDAWDFFHSRGATVGGGEWEKKHENKPVSDGNGRISYDGVSWMYPENVKANPCQCTYVSAEDGQGSVPCNDGLGSNG